MGACGGGGGTKPLQKKQTALIQRQASSILKQSQVILLDLIYRDLSSRSSDRKINLENFRLFFQKNGLWGQRLFQIFDNNGSNSLCFSQFKHGIAKIIKTTQKKKIELLFSFFAELSEDTKDGINFKQFLTMLYNYPKEDLKDIMDDQDFITTELKAYLIPQNGRRIQSIMQPRNIAAGPIMQCVFDDRQNVERLPSTFGRIVNSGVHKNTTTCNFKIGTNQIEVKTSNINNLVRKFARSLFKKYNMDPQSDLSRLNQAQFYQWIQGHKKLYHSYYQGFHNQVWEFDEEKQKPKFLNEPNEKVTYVKTNINGHFMKVKIILFHSIIVVCENEEDSKMVICLDGLAVKKKEYDVDNGFGIQISHRDGIYPVKQLYFKNQGVCGQWLQLLKCYKGDAVQQIYQMGERIGAGKFSIVYQCTQNMTKQKYAIKVIQTFKLEDDAKNMIAHESSIMGLLQNPFLVRYKETIQTKSHIYIITQLVEGKDLFQYVKQEKQLNQDETAIITYQILTGIKYMHSLGIVHRDLKPQNIMIWLTNDSKYKMIKIIDFGFANHMKSIKHDISEGEDLLVGTPNYIAPEILKGEPFSQKIDNFAIGAIIYYMLSGIPPFNGYNITQIFQKTMDGFYEYRTKAWKGVSESAKNFIDRLLQNDPNQRIGIQQALASDWIQNAIKKFKNQKNSEILHESGSIKKIKSPILF